MKSFLLLALLSFPIMSFSQNPQTNDENGLPYYQIPEYPEEYTATSTIAVLIDGLGFRYYWATDGLSENDLAFKPSEDGRTISETNDHIYDLVSIIFNAVKQQANTSSEEEISFQEKRKQTLLMLKEASDILRKSKPEDLKIFELIFKRGEGENRYPFWHNINGPIADALWHVGQIVSHRRASGNPITSKVSFFSGRVR